ncbi:uncharacterized protein LOC112679377 [Sipha flava]|uniref:Uncharacterized protein LOC112679377 n=1 Tax=Sipha flava TaxID=143950 RepID=A0A8B8F3S1_9HEMI|nr:uncharacterized protein LOC112679377 [Sipha flava]XP_025404948.1 uncharacterized protein LOC112679377 [Sipha flava]
MSKNNNKFMTTKLKGTEMLARHSQHKPLQSSSHNDFVASGSHTSDLQEQSTVWSNSIPKLIPETKQVIYGGRGLAISKLVETMSKTPGEPMDKWNYSNSAIESHFKKLREESAKKIKEDNEKIWGNWMHTKKKS